MDNAVALAGYKARIEARVTSMRSHRRLIDAMLAKVGCWLIGHQLESSVFGDAGPVLEVPIEGRAEWLVLGDAAPSIVTAGMNRLRERHHALNRSYVVLLAS